MTRFTSLVPSFALTALVSLAVSACGAVSSFEEGYREGASGGQNRPAPLSSSDCHEAVHTCEGFVAAFCNRIEQCGFKSFDECTNDLLDGHFPCDKADGADDFSTCDDEMGTASCDALGNGQIPQSCADSQIHFGDQLCE